MWEWVKPSIQEALFSDHCVDLIETEGGISFVVETKGREIY